MRFPYRLCPSRLQDEQDLVICRALVTMFHHPHLAKALAFRGGTALFKLHFPPARYSEDIDLVQVAAGPIKPIIDPLHEVLDPWLGKPAVRPRQNGIRLIYRFESEDALPLRLKVEINTREHFSLHGTVEEPFRVESRWFSGEAAIRTYSLEELLGTKLRALLYQRKKGRDLFDLWYAFNGSSAEPSVDAVVEAFLGTMEHGENKISRALFEQNLLEKRKDPQFAGDIAPLLTAGSRYDFEAAFDFVLQDLIARLPGEPWRGSG